MDIGSIFLVLALILLVALFISRPFLDHRSENQPLLAKDRVLQVDHQRSSLLAERDRVMNALQELEFDALLGKIPAEDYPVNRGSLMQAGADVLRRLDQLQGETKEGSPEARMEDAVAVITEQAAAQARMQAASLASTESASTQSASTTSASSGEQIASAQTASTQSASTQSASAQAASAGAQAANVEAAPVQTLEEDELENLIAARRRSRVEKSGGFCPRCGNPVQKSDVFCSRCGKNL